MHPAHPVSAFVALLVGLSQAAAVLAERAEDSITPHAQVLDIPYSPDHPPGPVFSEAEKQHQMAEGLRIRSEIVAAFVEGRDFYTIPPSDYRFGADWHASPGSFVLRNLHRSAERPFRILGHGATFWFQVGDRPAPSAHRMVQIIGCSQLSLEGITIDSDPRGCIDARVTAFDFPGNRIQVQPLPGTRLIPRVPDAEGRFIPYNNHGYWYNAETVTGRTMTFAKDLPSLLAAGHQAEVFDAQQKTFLGELTVDGVAAHTVTFREELSKASIKPAVLFREFQNPGWVVRNCFFVDCLSENRTLADPGMRAESLIRNLTKTHGSPAIEIIRQVKAGL